jgi:hypothetical protein
MPVDLRELLEKSGSERILTTINTQSSPWDLTPLLSNAACLLTNAEQSGKSGDELADLLGNIGIPLVEAIANTGNELILLAESTPTQMMGVAPEQVADATALLRWILEDHGIPNVNTAISLVGKDLIMSVRLPQIMPNLTINDSAINEGAIITDPEHGKI